jgi:hypothetical protein
MVDAATRIHDGIYSPSSPTPVPKMCGCTEPKNQCVELAVYSKGQCTVPRFIPRGFITDCPNRVYDWKPGQSAQRGSKESKAPGVRDSTSAVIYKWIAWTLQEIANHGDNRVRAYARSLLLDTDYTTDLATVQMLGETMLERLNQEKPWVRA